MNELTALEQYILDNNRVWPFPTYEAAAISDRGFTGNCVTKDEFNKRIAEENRPNFEDHPDAKCFACDRSGGWFKSTLKSKVEINGSTWVNSERLSTTGWVYLQKGNPIGGWKESLMIRPEEKAEAKWVPSVGDVCVTVAGDFTIDYVGKRQVFGHYKLGIENQYRISELVKKEICDKEMFVNKLRESVVGVSCDKDLEDLYDKGFRYMGELYE